MRWGTRALAGAALLATACGNWSNDDIAFVEALPNAQALRVALPAQAGQPLCGALGTSQVWAFAKPTGDNLNAGADALLALIDLVRRATPTTRGEDERTWGPFDDRNHPGVELRIVMRRTRDAAGVPTYDYTFGARVKIQGGDFQPVLDGSFTGDSARAGGGTLVLEFPALRALGMNDKPTDPTTPMKVTYDRRADPRTLTVDVPSGGFDLASFDYGYIGYASGQGEFDYAFVNQAGDRVVVSALFDARGAGGARVSATDHVSGLTFGFTECWDAASCITAVNDPFNFAKHCASGPCVVAGACPSNL
jgi:hypothetical protein